VVALFSCFFNLCSLFAKGNARPPTFTPRSTFFLRRPIHPLPQFHSPIGFSPPSITDQFVKVPKFCFVKPSFSLRLNNSSFFPYPCLSWFQFRFSSYNFTPRGGIYKGPSPFGTISDLVFFLFSTGRFFESVLLFSCRLFPFFLFLHALFNLIFFFEENFCLPFPPQTDVLDLPLILSFPLFFLLCLRRFIRFGDKCLVFSPMGEGNFLIVPPFR